MNEKSSKQEIDSLNLKYAACERQLNELKVRIGNKDKESNILMFKLKERERKNFNTL